MQEKDTHTTSIGIQIHPSTSTFEQQMPEPKVEMANKLLAKFGSALNKGVAAKKEEAFKSNIEALKA